MSRPVSQAGSGIFGTLTAASLRWAGFLAGRSAAELPEPPGSVKKIVTFEPSSCVLNGTSLHKINHDSRLPGIGLPHAHVQDRRVFAGHFVLLDIQARIGKIQDEPRRGVQARSLVMQFAGPADAHGRLLPWLSDFDSRDRGQVVRPRSRVFAERLARSRAEPPPRRLPATGSRTREPANWSSLLFSWTWVKSLGHHAFQRFSKCVFANLVE